MLFAVRRGLFLIASIYALLLQGEVFGQFETAPLINTSGQTGILHTESARGLGFGRLVLGSSADMSMGNGFCSEVSLDSLKLSNPGSFEYNFAPFIGFGLAKILDISAMLPIYFDKIPTYEYDSSLVKKTYGGVQAGLGDCELRLKLAVLPHTTARLADLAFSLGVILPSGDKNTGYFLRHSYYILRDSTVHLPNGSDNTGVSGIFSSGIAEYDIKMLVTINGWEKSDYTTLMGHINYGLRLLNARGFDQAALLAAGLEYRPAKWFCLYSEVNAETRLDNFLKGNIRRDILTMSPGICLTPDGGLFLNVNAEINLANDNQLSYIAKGAIITSELQPPWRIGVSIGWAGFINHSWQGGGNTKKSPRLDSDGDGIIDSLDKCPNVPEDFDGFEDADGCPDYDNDKDGISDSLDKCPNEAEDFDGFEDSDGCPEIDNDKDGICDPWVAEKGMQAKYADICTGLDKCPNLPEDKDGFEDFDGCPDFDNDLDGVPDTLDKCPNDYGPADNNGCPKSNQGKAKEIKRGRLILRAVEFKPNNSELTSESYPMLDDVYESMKAYPDVRIEIAGYTDNVGTPANNKKNSLRRAETVRAYLILKGIDPSRISAVGRGSEDPIANNTTQDGRAFNRRIEMKRID